VTAVRSHRSPLLWLALVWLAPARAGAEPAEVHVAGQRNEGERLQGSSEAVTVVDARRARAQASDLGEVMARTQGVAVRRDGGLGSNARFSLNGLYDDQIRFFLDGVPLEIAGYPFGIANVPVNLLERVDVYRGVVPVRLGADALGGAVNLIPRRVEDGVAASYQVGSFGTQRVAATASHRAASGLFVRGEGFFDAAKNNYAIDVEVPDARGRLAPARVRRFHDDYRAYGGSVEAGVLGQSWARRLSLRAFGSTYDKDLQHNVVMTVPYGDVTYGESVLGANARYEHTFGRDVDVDVVVAYSHRTIDFADAGSWVYDWFGRRVRARSTPGEIERDPSRSTLWQSSVFSRAQAAWRVSDAHTIRLSTSPSFTTRTGDERLQADPNARDPLGARRDLLTLVTGLEHHLEAFRGARREGAFESSLFVKDYVYRASSEEVLPGNIFRPLSRDTHRLGFGGSLRVRATGWLLAKASYELATRLPRPDEVFGNGVLVLPNLRLDPEVSHNANVGPRVEVRRSLAGSFVFDVNAFLRDSDRLVVLLGNDRRFSYQNVFRARALGVEGAASWSSPGRLLTVDGATTFMDQRNRSTEGTFRDFEGDRIPNRPWLFASFGARLRFERVLGAGDTLEPFYVGRYVHSFFRGWESQGLRDFKQVVDAQLAHGAGVTYAFATELARLATTFEVQNLTNAALYDNFGVQRPGRALFLKLDAEL